MICITHDQLGELQSHRGQVDRNSGLVFVGVRGQMDPHTHLWQLEVVTRALEEGDQLASFSMAEIVGPAPQINEPAEPAVPPKGGCCP